MSEADILQKKGDKKLKAFFVFGDRYEQALDYYERAYNLYRSLKNEKEAEKVISKILHILQKKSDYYSSAQYLEKKFSLNQDQGCLRQAVEIYNKLGKFNHSGRIIEQLADLNNSIEQYQQAADYYQIDNNTKAFQCLLKKANLLALNKEYNLAIQYFDQLVSHYLDDKLRRYGTKELVFKIILCYMVLDENALEMLYHYRDLDSHFQDSIEDQLLEKLIVALEKNKLEDFRIALRDYDNVKRLEPWYINILTEIKNKFNIIDLT
jgi:alpha-soluble NSF attachment protein